MEKKWITTEQMIENLKIDGNEHEYVPIVRRHHIFP